LPAKLDRCVADVKAKGDVDNAWAVCNASIDEIQEMSEKMFETHNPLDIPFGHEVNEGGPGSGRKPTGAHGVVPGELPPVKTPRAKPSTPSSAITPMGKGKATTSHQGLREAEEDLCRECGKPRSDHGMFTDHKFAEEPEELDEGDVDDLDDNIKSITIKYKESFSVPGGLSAQSVGGKKIKIEEIEACPCFDSLHRALVQ